MLLTMFAWTGSLLATRWKKPKTCFPWPGSSSLRATARMQETAAGSRAWQRRLRKRRVILVRVGAFALIFNDQNEVLLCHRGDLDLWNLPSGGMEPGESPWEAVVREVEEEVGLTVEVERPTGVYAKPEQEEIVFSLICRVIEGELTTSDGADDVRYLAADQLPRNTSPRQVERIQDALHSSNQTVLKVQTEPSSQDLVRSGKWPG